MECPYCHNDNPDGSMFCLYCVMPLPDPAVQQVQNMQVSPLQQFPVQPVLVPSPPVPPVQNQHVQLVAGLKPSQPVARLVVLDNMQPTGESVNLPEPPYNSSLILGRNDLLHGMVVDIDLVRFGGYDRKVSRKHAAIGYETDHYTIEDLGSSHGTYINKRKISPGTVETLKAGDEIKMAELTVKLEVVGSGTP